MSRGETRGAEPACVLETDSELDLAIAEDVRVGRATGSKLIEEMSEHPRAVLGSEIHHVQRDAEILADAACILQVRGCRAVAVVVVPVAHEERVHLASRARQQRGGDGGIDAA